MVRVWWRPTMGSGRTMGYFERCPIPYPTARPFGSWKCIETCTSLYAQPKRQTKPVISIVISSFNNALTCCVACWLIVVCLGTGGGAPWRPWDDGGCHGWPVHVFCLALASFYLGTSRVRCPPTPYPTNNQPPIHPIISVNNRQMRMFQVAILCTCMVGRRLCCMVA